MTKLRKSLIVATTAAAITVGGAGAASAHPVMDPQDTYCEGPGLSVYGGVCQPTHIITVPPVHHNNWWAMATFGVVALIILF